MIENIKERLFEIILVMAVFVGSAYTLTGMLLGDMTILSFAQFDYSSLTISLGFNAYTIIILPMFIATSLCKSKIKNIFIAIISIIMFAQLNYQLMILFYFVVIMLKGDKGNIRNILLMSIISLVLFMLFSQLQISFYGYIFVIIFILNILFKDSTKSQDVLSYLLMITLVVSDQYGISIYSNTLFIGALMFSLFYRKYNFVLYILSLWLTLAVAMPFLGVFSLALYLLSDYYKQFNNIMWVRLAISYSVCAVFVIACTSTLAVDTLFISAALLLLTIKIINNKVKYEF